MAVKTYRVAAGNDASSGVLVDGVDQTAANRTDGWTVAKSAAGNSAEFWAGLKNVASSFNPNSTTPKPDATNIYTSSFKTLVALTGTFAATSWTLTFAVRAATASSQAGRVRLRVFKSTDPAGALDGAMVELTGATQVGTTTSTLSTTADVTSVVTWSPGAITLSNEYLFFALAWEITTPSGSNNGDVLVRTGQAAGGSRIVTPDLVVAGAAEKKPRIVSTNVPAMRAALR